LKEYDDAVVSSKRAIEIDKEPVGAWFDLGVAYGNLEKHKEAKECFEKVTELDKENVDAWIGLGATQGYLGRHKEAKECFEKAIELDKENVNVWINFGALHVKLKNYEEAKKCFEKAIKLDPKDEEATASLIELLIIRGDYGEAFEKARANVDLFKTDKYRFLSSFFAVLSVALQNKHEAFLEWISKLLQDLKKSEKPYGVSWDFADIKPTLEQDLEKEEMSLISLLVDVLKEEKDLVELEKALKIKKR
jgi:tetratricopeptide (TPR) repeat protein